MVVSTFRFNKAGQGCFYTGFLKARASNTRAFSVVYDCGTSSPKLHLKNEIHKFHASVKVKSAGKLNLLIISHFDADHVNQLRLLLTGVSGVDYIILPYLTPAERLIVYLNAVEADADFVSFLANPAGFLKSLNAHIGKILFVRGDEERRQEINLDRPSPDNPGEDKVWICDYTELKGTAAPENFGDSSVEIVADKGRFFAGDSWEFYFYNKPVDAAALAAFTAEIEVEFPHLFDGDTFQKKNLLRDDSIEQLKGKYRTLIGRNLNPSSLVVYHTPIHNDAVRRLLVYKCRWPHYQAHAEAPASLLLGDIYLQGLTFPPYINANGKKVGVVQIPHHGAATNWDFTVLTSILHPHVIAVVNFGLGNNYDHPKQKVIDDINAAGWRIKLNHQLKTFKYRIWQVVPAPSI